MVTVASSGPVTVIRTGPVGAPSNVNRPNRSDSCSRELSVPSRRTVVACAGTSWPTSRRVVGVGDHHLDLQPGGLERQLAGPPVVAHAHQLGRRVEHEIGELLVDRPPRERPTGCGEDVFGHRVGLAQGEPEQFLQGVVGEFGWVTTVVTHHPPAFGSMPAGSSRRSLSRHRALLGPMLPIDRPRISAIVW